MADDPPNLPAGKTPAVLFGIIPLPVTLRLPLIATTKRHSKLSISKPDREAFLSAAGAWEGIVDAERLKAEIYKSRGSDRPAVEL